MKGERLKGNTSWRVVIVALMLSFVIPLQAQRRDFLSSSEILLMGGGMNYLGDLNDQSMFGRVNMAGGLQMRYCFDSRWSMALGGVYGHIEGGNPDVVKQIEHFRVGSPRRV